jgi:hypothetical protein
MSTTVSQIGGNTTVVSTGEANYLWNDKNNNGVVDNGDLIARTRQADQSVTTYIVGKDEGMIAWGDPHLDNIAFSKDGKAALNRALQSAFADAKDGKLDDNALLGHIDLAIATGGVRDNIMDFHANIATQLTDRTRVEFKVVIDKNFSEKVAFTDAADIDVTGVDGKKRTVTFTEIYTGNGGAGQSAALESTGNSKLQAVASPNNLRVFSEYTGANVMHGVSMFGTDAGTADYAHVVDVNGNLNTGMGKMTRESMAFYDNLMAGRETLAAAMQLGGYCEEEQDEAEKATAAAGTNARTRATANDLGRR